MLITMPFLGWAVHIPFDYTSRTIPSLGWVYGNPGLTVPCLGWVYGYPGLCLDP